MSFRHANIIHVHQYVRDETEAKMGPTMYMYVYIVVSVQAGSAKRSSKTIENGSSPNMPALIGGSKEARPRS